MTASTNRTPKAPWRRALALCCLLTAPLAADSSFPEVPTDDGGYALATPGVALQFPRDHGAHPQFKSEWWYLTGHLATENGDAAYGFQLTFFRAAGSDGQSYLAHAALFDKRSGAYLHEERLNSGLWNADAAVGKLDTYNGNWYLRMVDEDSERMVARFSLADFGTLSLTLQPVKPKTLFGESGYSRKGPDRGAASYYITFTRLEASATAELKDGRSLTLGGLVWMDHEFSSSQLSDGQIGWNWTSLILDDGSELMAYVMRREDGKTDPYSSLNLIDPSGRLTRITAEDFTWEPTRFWQSDSGARYPVDYEIRLQHGGDTRLVRVKASGDDQELRDQIGEFVYWEGACQAFDAQGERIGIGYTELTGYESSLKGRF